MLFNRHKHLLMLLKSFGGKLSNRDFQKLLFLFNMENVDISQHQFVPYKYGGFSFTSYADRRKLVREEYLEDNSDKWVLTPKIDSLKFNDQETLSKMMRFNRLNKLRGNKLIAETYRRYPYYATKSEIMHDIGLSSSEIKTIKSASVKQDGGGLFTIGYEGRSLEQYMNILLQAGITVLCDVRKNPLSRKFGFSKGVLSETCENLSIKYEHLPQLGIVSDRRKELKGIDDYKELFDAYKQDTLPFQDKELALIQSWVKAGERVALTCFEHEAEMCHRHCVSDVLSSFSQKSLIVSHL